jgi:chaperonin GroEL
VVIIIICAATEPKMKEKTNCVGDALHDRRATVEEGVSLGGCVVRLRTQKTISALKLEGDEAIGADIVHRAIEAPLAQLCQNAGAEGAVIVQEMLRGKGSFWLQCCDKNVREPHEGWSC